MTEQLAKGRFSWCKLRVTYHDGTVIDEDRTDVSWWDNLPKETIRLLTIVPTGDNLPEHAEEVSVGVGPVGCERRYGFFHFKRAKKTFGFLTGVTSSDEIAYVIGMIHNMNGNANLIEMYRDFSHATFDINIIDSRLNLEQQGIELLKIGDLL